MRWKIHGERPIYENDWVNLWLTDVETPDGNRWEHHVVKLRHLAVAAVVNERREILMVWRHRFITNAWAWELPMGLVEEGETPAETAAREVREETGWRPHPLRTLIYAEPANGITELRVRALGRFQLETLPTRTSRQGDVKMPEPTPPSGQSEILVSEREGPQVWSGRPTVSDRSTRTSG